MRAVRRFLLLALLVLVPLGSPARAAGHTVSDPRGDQMLPLDASYDIVSADVVIRQGQLIASITMAAPIDVANGDGRWLMLLAAVPACPDGQLTWAIMNPMHLPVEFSAASDLTCGHDRVRLDQHIVVSGRTVTWRTPWKAVASHLPPHGAYATDFQVISDVEDPATGLVGTRYLHADVKSVTMDLFDADTAYSAAWLRLT